MRILQRRSSLASLALGLVIVSVLAALAALALTSGGIQAQATVPAAPTGLTGSVSHDNVSLTWEDPGDDSVTGYRVLRRSRDGDGDEYGGRRGRGRVRRRHRRLRLPGGLLHRHLTPHGHTHFWRVAEPTFSTGDVVNVWLYRPDLSQ